MKTTKEIFEQLEQDAINIACLGSHLLEQIKERDTEIADLKLQLETINHPKKKDNDTN
tara:strand:- start:2290 stop:2463 length:174 start_codon:yes stop_codon:yes gene_type:complete